MAWRMLHFQGVKVWKVYRLLIGRAERKFVPIQWLMNFTSQFKIEDNNLTNYIVIPINVPEIWGCVLGWINWNPKGIKLRRRVTLVQ